MGKGVNNTNLLLHSATDNSKMYIYRQSRGDFHSFFSLAVWGERVGFGLVLKERKGLPDCQSESMHANSVSV